MGVRRRAHDRFAAHIKRRVHQHRASGERFAAPQQFRDRVELRFELWARALPSPSRSRNAHKHRVPAVMLDLLKDLWRFARERKKVWLVPLIGMLLVLSVLVGLSQYSVVAPFIYTLF